MRRLIAPGLCIRLAPAFADTLVDRPAFGLFRQVENILGAQQGRRQCVKKCVQTVTVERLIDRETDTFR